MQQLREGRKESVKLSVDERFVSIRLSRIEDSSCIAMHDPVVHVNMAGMDDDGPTTGESCPRR